MSIRTLSTKAVTLTELLIATIIVTIIMMGVVSTDLSLRSFEKASIGQATATLNTKAMTHEIKKITESAIGYGCAEIPPSQFCGIHIDGHATFDGDASTNQDDTFCFRHQVIGPTEYASGYTNDNWECYTPVNCQIGCANPPCYCDLYRCTIPAGGVDQPPSLATDVCDANDEYIGRINEDTFSNPANPDFTVDESIYTMEFTFTITTRGDYSVAQDDHSNPEVTETVTTSPLKHFF